MGKCAEIARRWHGIHPKHMVEFERPWYLEPIFDDEVVVDLGCGTGKHLERIQQDHDVHVLGFDKDDTNALYTDLEWCIPLPDAFADKVFLFNVLEHIENRGFLLRNIRRILKPDGLLMLSIPNADTKPKRLRKRMGFDDRADKDHKIEYLWSTIQNELHRAGFKIMYWEPTVIDTIWAGLIDLSSIVSMGMYTRLAMWKRKKAFENRADTTGWRMVCTLEVEE